MRTRVRGLVKVLGEWGSLAVVHGSLARGDVDEQSDIDLLVKETVSTQLVESRLETGGFTVFQRELVQATPVHSPKAHIYLDPEQLTSVTIPLLPLRKLESEFYKFGGAIGSDELSRAERVPGVTKRLLLIEPNELGHSESSVIDRESETAATLGISLQIVEERVRVLERRDRVGRTGVFLRVPVPDESSFEVELSKQARENPALRRTLRSRSS